MFFLELLLVCTKHCILGTRKKTCCFGDGLTQFFSHHNVALSCPSSLLLCYSLYLSEVLLLFLINVQYTVLPTYWQILFNYLVSRKFILYVFELSFIFISGLSLKNMSLNFCQLATSSSYFAVIIEKFACEPWFIQASIQFYKCYAKQVYITQIQVSICKVQMYFSADTSACLT